MPSEDSMHPVKLSLAAAAALLIAAAAAAGAAEYPVKPVRIVIGFPPGGASDILVRFIGSRLAEGLGQAIVYDNRPGAGGNIAGEIVAKSPPDGYTLLMGNNAILATNVSLYRKIGFDPLRDFAPVALLATQPNILVVHPSLPVKSVKELIAFARARPGQLNYASSGSGLAAHLAGELFKVMTRTDLVHVPYKGAGPALLDTLTGQCQVMFATAVSVQPHLKSGRLRALAVTTAARSKNFPQLPTVAEAGVPGFEASTWHGIVAPAGTPQPVIARLNGEINKVLQLPDTRERLAAQGADAGGGTPQQFGDFIRAEIPKWAKVIEASGARVD
ncbi:MAG TPA: tripartite tricarboxylate transporter substrate binding protein [Burkholderiales bacterium]|nr:tripartite tricarboxylate transporter substrate binding protein [Burkholderiales bacterium]